MLLVKLQGGITVTKRTSTAKWSESKSCWRIDIQKDGIRKSFYSSKAGRAGQREANAKADAWLESNVETTAIRANQALDEFLELKVQSVSRSQYLKLESISRLYVRPVIGKKKMDRVTFDDLQTIIDIAISKKLSAKTVSNIRSVISQFMRFCRRKKYTILTTDDLDVTAAGRKQTKRILQPESIVKLFGSNLVRLRGKWVYDTYVNTFRFLVVTGLRPGELIGLKWEDIGHNVIRLQRAVNIHGEITRGKNENAVRSVPLTKIANKILSDQYNQTGMRNGFVFGVSSESTLRHRWKSYCTSNEIPYCSLYELRHTFVSLVSSIPEGQLKQIVGHSKNMDTFGVYGHAVDGQLENTSIQIDQIFSGILNK